MIIPIFLGFCVLSLGGLGYFTIWRLTDSTYTTTKSYASNFDLMRADVQENKDFRHEVEAIIKGLDQRLADLETEIKLQKFDASRIIEWLDKEGVTRKKLNDEFIKSLKLTERESKIIQISEQLKLITSRKS